jgi:hypothetical protein
MAERIMMDPKDRYIAEAAEHGRCTENDDYKKGNMAYDRLMSALAELRGHADISCRCEQNSPLPFLSTSQPVRRANWNSTQKWFCENGERGG